MRPSAELSALGAAAAAGIGSLVWILWKSRRDPRERERRRRMLVGRHGRMGDAFITDVVDNTLYYTYTVHGVEYASSQDISPVRELLPENIESVIGPVTLKYMPANPENSIIAGEEWFGIRAKQRRMLLKGA